MRFPLLAAAVLALVAALPASAQPQRNAAPVSGTIQVGAEVATLAIQAGGPDRNAVPGNGCSGFISTRPNAAVTFDGSGAFAIYATSDTDTTLLILDPAGRWHCSDDANGSNPARCRASGGPGTRCPRATSLVNEA